MKCTDGRRTSDILGNRAAGNRKRSDELVPVILGTLLVTMAIFADRFKVGLTTRMYVSAWQGRTSLLLFGAGLLMVGLSHLLHWSNEATWQRVFNGIWDGYELLVGAVVMVLGALFAIAGKGKAPARVRWLAFAGSVAGAIFLVDGLTKIMN